MHATPTNPRRRALSFIEVMIVTVILGILAAIVVPQFGGATEDARVADLQSALGGVRSGIAGFRAKQIISGAAPYPTAAALASPGAVIQGEFPVNPWNNLALVQAVTQAQAAERAVIEPERYGWNYYMDNTATPPVAIFYANCERKTTVPDGAGGLKTANRL